MWQGLIAYRIYRVSVTESVLCSFVNILFIHYVAHHHDHTLYLTQHYITLKIKMHKRLLTC